MLQSASVDARRTAIQYFKSPFISSGDSMQYNYLLDRTVTYFTDIRTVSIASIMIDYSDSFIFQKVQPTTP